MTLQEEAKIGKEYCVRSKPRYMVYTGNVINSSGIFWYIRTPFRNLFVKTFRYVRIKLL